MGTETAKKVKRMEGLTGIRVHLEYATIAQPFLVLRPLLRGFGTEEILHLGKEAAGLGMSLAGRQPVEFGQ